MTTEMTREEFWTIVESVGWKTVDCDYKRGRAVLRQALPTTAALRQYERHFGTHIRALGDAINSFEEQEDVQLHCGDDSFSDLMAHVIGLGREEYERTLADPDLAYVRSVDADYRESFSYCAPNASDYDPTDIKLARAVQALLYWQEQLAEWGPEGCNQSEVDRRQGEVDALRVELAAEGGTEMTEAEYEAHIRAEVAARDARIEAVRAQRKAKEAAKAELLAKFEAEWS